mmetsp:Transcript_29310/g.44721  ORF Transcript_29310/g.44721 Transcript_29310/m.44721 type:complete len:295 (+) Transcript_29310:123-1007(+)
MTRKLSLLVALTMIVSTLAGSQPGIQNCDDDKYKTCPNLPDYFRFCDVDGSVLKDEVVPRTICAPLKIIHEVVKAEDYCGDCLRTEPPTSAMPTTPAPAPVMEIITEAPITASPVTPATLAPNTASPITASPVTESPTTASPTTASPTTKAPVTVAPITASPVTSAPVTASPVTPAPVVSEPVTASTTTPTSVTPVPVTPAPVSAIPTPAAPAGVIEGGDECIAPVGSVCSVCGEGKCVQNPTNEFAIAGYPTISCGTLQDVGYQGMIAVDQCKMVPTLADQKCGCSTKATPSS